MAADTGLPTAYNFSCTATCSYWVLYLLDSSMPLSGWCSNLPCMVETSSIDNDVKIARQSLDMKMSGRWMTIASNGTLMAVAQCAYNYQGLTLFRAAVMLRQSNIASCSLPPTTIGVPTQSAPTTAAVATTAIVNSNTTNFSGFPGGQLKRRHAARRSATAT